jgi:hypothetical protein
MLRIAEMEVQISEISVLLEARDEALKKARDQAAVNASHSFVEDDTNRILYLEEEISRLRPLELLKYEIDSVRQEMEQNKLTK